MDPFFFILNNGLVLILAFSIAYRLLRTRSFELTLLGSAVLFPTIILMVLLVLGAFGILYNCWVTLFLALLFLIICTRAIWRHCQQYSFAGWKFFIPVLMVICGVIGGSIAGRFVFHGTHFSFDDFSYHAVAVGHWIQDHSLWSGPFNYHYHNPMNAEVLSCWWMLPFGQDGFAFLTGVYWLFLSCLSIFILCGRIGVSSLWIRLFIAFVALITKHSYAQASATFAGVDLAGPAMVLASLAFLSFRSDAEQRLNSRLSVFAGLACGFAVGCKVPFATVVFLLAVWILLGRSYNRSLRSRLSNTALFVLGVLLTGFWWYGKNIYLTGNPVFPGQLGPFAGPLTSAIQFHTKITGLLVDSGFSPKVITDLFLKHLNWPGSLAVLALAGYMGAGLGCLLDKHSPKQTTQTRLLLLVCGVVMFLTYINMPFSGRYNSPDAPVQFSLRFVIGPYLVGIILYSQLMNMSGVIKWLFRAVFFAAVTAAIVKAGYVLYAAAAVMMIAAAVVAEMFKSIHFSIERGLARILTLCLGVLGGLSMTFSFQQERTNRNVFEYRTKQSQNGLAWQQLESFPPGTISAAMGPNYYLCYPLLGRRLQDHYYAFDKTGTVRQRLYERYRNNPENTLWWGGGSDKTWQPESYLQNVKAAGVDCLFIFRRDDGTWPIDSETLARAGWQCVWKNKGIRIWKPLP